MSVCEEHGGDEAKREAAKCFVDWIQSSESGIQCKSVELRYCGGSAGFGVFAKQTIRWNDCLIKIPQRLIIYADLIRSIPEYAALFRNEKLPSFDSFEVLVLFFCMERFHSKDISTRNSTRNKTTALKEFYQRRVNLNKRKAEPDIWLAKNLERPWFRAYMRMLPRRFGTALEACHDAHSGAYNASEKQRIAGALPMHAREIFQKQLDEFERVSKKLNVLFGSEADESLFLWGWHIVNTRCIWADPTEFSDSSSFAHEPSSYFGNKDEKRKASDKKSDSDNTSDSPDSNGDCIAVIPFVDMLNHSPMAQCVASYDRHSKFYRVCATHRTIVEGSEVFVCYGPHDNARLWLEYGFRLGPENIFNRVNISTNLFIQLARESGLAVGNLDAHHEQVIREADLPCTIYGSDEEPSYGIRKNCRIAFLKRSQLTNWRRIIFRERSSTPYNENENEDKMKAGNGEKNEDENGRKSHAPPTPVNDANVDTLAQRMVHRVLLDLRAHTARKSEKISDAGLRVFWTDQIYVLDNLLAKHISNE